MSKWRRYLYLLVDRCDKATYPLRRIDSSGLFFPTDQHITPTTVEDARLPQPCISFTPTPSSDCSSRIVYLFTLFGRGEKKSLIAGADENGVTVIYDLNE